MTRPELLLGPGAVSRSTDGLELSIRQPWYRSLPLSSVVDLEINVAGKPVDRSDIVFSLDGRDLGLDELPALWDTVWFIQDAARVRVPVDAPEGSTATVALTLRFPYIIIDGVGPLQRRTVAEQTVPGRTTDS